MPNRQNVMTIWGGWKCILNLCNPWRQVFPVKELGCCMTEFVHGHTISTMAWNFFMENFFFRLICLLGLAITRVKVSFSSLNHFYRMALWTALIHFFSINEQWCIPWKSGKTEATAYDCFLFSRQYKRFHFLTIFLSGYQIHQDFRANSFPVNPNPKATPLAKLYNNSRPDDEIPVVWKSSVTCPIYKKGCRNNVANYRPICLTSKSLLNPGENCQSKHPTIS